MPQTARRTRKTTGPLPASDPEWINLAAAARLSGRTELVVLTQALAGRIRTNQIPGLVILFSRADCLKHRPPGPNTGG